jgi:hypothetical protein
VMSDWQRCVNGLLAKYCRCRLRLDWCWCRWRTSVKGLCQWAPPGVGQTNMLVSRDLVTSGIKCRPHGGKNSKTKSCTVLWLNLKAKIEPGRRGGQVMSGDWREVTPSPRGFQWFTTKPLGYLVEP